LSAPEGPWQLYFDSNANPRVEWFDRRDMKKLADTFLEHMSSLEPP
jgi:hypothetical protein